jgi:hypothetical protein
MAKKDFEWTTTQQVGVVDVNERERRLVQFCSLDIEREDETETRWYIAIATMKFFKKKGEDTETWRTVKNATFPMDTWVEIVDLVNENIEFE